MPEAAGIDQLSTLDDGQRRMIEAANFLFSIPEVYAKIHEFDDAYQTSPPRAPAPRQDAMF